MVVMEENTTSQKDRITAITRTTSPPGTMAIAIPTITTTIRFLDSTREIQTTKTIEITTTTGILSSSSSSTTIVENVAALTTTTTEIENPTMSRTSLRIPFPNTPPTNWRKP